MEKYIDRKQIDETKFYELCREFEMSFCNWYKDVFLEDVGMDNAITLLTINKIEERKEK